MARTSLSCPHCDEAISVNAAARIAEGRTSLRCPECGARISLPGARASKRRKPTPRPIASTPWPWIIGIAALFAILLISGTVGAIIYINRTKATNATVDVAQENRPTPPVFVPKPSTAPVNSPRTNPQQRPPQESPKPKEQSPAIQTLQPIIYLEPPDPPSDWTISHSVLQRELMRQSVLLCARDYLGVTTRDAVLGEGAPDNLPDTNRFHVTVRVQTQKGKAGKFTLERGPAQARNVIATGDVSFATPDAASLVEITRHAEYYSREHWLEALKKVGYQGKANAVSPDLRVPEATERLIAKMDFLSQYSALRDLHSLIQKEGESPWLLGGLVRAYANLGVLTEFQFDSANKVFKARALLYAQRMAIANPTSPWAFWHRAYAYALTGLHKAALDDLAKGTKLAGENKEAVGDENDLIHEPGWAPLLDAFCRFDFTKMTEPAKTESLLPLAHLLRYIAAEDRYCVNWVTDAAKPVLEESPECYRVYDNLSHIGSISLHHTMTLAGYDVFTKTFPARLPEMNGLPDAVAKLVRENAPEPEVVRSLIAAGQSAQDRVDPSWTVLGTMARELRVVQVTRRLEFMAKQWNVPVNDFLKESLPLVADHPFLPLIKSYALDPKRQRAEYQNLILNLPLRDLNFSQTPIVNAMQAADEKKSLEHSAKIYRFLDDLHRDYMLILWYRSKLDDSSQFALNLLRFSPYSPIARAIVIRDKWDVAQKYADEWEKSSQHPRVLQELGRQYVNLRRPADAERCLKKCVALSPDKDTYTLLADAYTIQGKPDLAKKTLDEFLKSGKDTGLDRMQIEVSIARGYMREKDYKAAVSHADAAADSYAADGLRCASECHEALEEWDKAEALIRALSERYPEHCYYWLYFCKRTGHGNVRAAEKLVVNYLVGLGKQLAPEDLYSFAVFYVLTKQHGKALDILLKLYQEKPSDSLGWMVMVTYDGLGKKEERDKTLKTFPGQNGTGKQLTDLFIDCLSKGETSPLDLEAVEAILKRMTTPGAAENTCYFIGRFLEKRGQTDAALQYLDRCATSPQQGNEVTYKTLYQTLAMAHLRDRGIEPGKIMGSVPK